MDSQLRQKLDDMDVSKDDLTAHAEGRQKAKDKLYFMSLETHFFTKQLKKYESNYNKIDISLATMLFDAVDAISEFLKTAQIEENDEDSDVFEVIPSIENDICEAHRSYFCKACLQSVRSSPKAFTDHFYGNKHVRMLRKFEEGIGTQENLKKHRRGDQQRGSTQSLSSINSTNVTNKPKKERLNSLPLRGPVKKEIESLPKKMQEFLAKSELDNFSAEILSEGFQLMKSPKYKRVCSLLERSLKSKFPGVQAYPFGSVVIGLGSKRSDLDVFIDIENSYKEKPSKRKMKHAIHETQRILMSSGKGVWEGFQPVTKARTPILKVYCSAEKVDCDLSFSNGLSSCNTELIGFFIGLQPVCKKLVTFVKFWASELQLGTNSYLISLLVIFYLQSEKILPSVRKLQEKCVPISIDGWNAGFEPMTLEQLKIPLITDFKKYLIGFFHFYGFTFNLGQHIVSVLTGEPIEKKLFDHGQEHLLPEAFDPYKKYMAAINLDEADQVEDLFSNHKPFVVQDPFELCHNVAKGLQRPKIKNMLVYLRQTHEILSQRQKI